MLLVFTTTLPLFVLILAGYASARARLIDAAGVRGLTGFVYYFSLPLTLFHMMATAQVVERFDGAFVGAYLAAALLMCATGVAIARWILRHRLDEQAVQGMAASFGNLVFIALPIAIELYGPGAALPVLLLLLVENGVIMPLAIVLIELARSGPGTAWRAPAAAGRAIVRNPVIMSVAAGAAVALFGVRLPSLLDGIVNFVKGANVPCALFALGATLAVMPRGERLRESGALVLLKLAMFPAVVYLLMTHAVSVDPAWRAIAVLCAAMPMGANVFLIAARYDVYVARASAGVLVSTAASVVTVSALAVLLAR
ncbi:MAG: AEC family transporter [Burkholderiales bacterium]|nr:AEC family transporter [Burkholderiales bacterium]